MKFDGGKLKAIRTERGLTMVDLVLKLGITNQSYISQLEKGARNPRPNISKRIAEVFNVPESYFYLDETPVNADNLPDMPEHLKTFILNPDNIEFLEVAYKTNIIKARLNDNSHRLKAIEERLIELTRRAPADYMNESQIAEILQKFAAKEKSPDTSRAVLDTFLDNVVVSNSELIITLNLGNCWWRRTESSGIPKNLLLIEYQKARRY